MKTKEKQKPVAELSGFCYNLFTIQDFVYRLYNFWGVEKCVKGFHLCVQTLVAFLAKITSYFRKAVMFTQVFVFHFVFKERSARSNYSLAYPLTFVKSVVLYFCQVLTKIWLNIGGYPQKNYILHH